MTRPYLWAYVATLLVFLPFDGAWLASMGPRLYTPTLGHLLAVQPDALAIAAFYPLYFLGVVVFAVRPTTSDASWMAAAGRGALFGLVAYGTYDLTNQATLRGWPWWLTGIDLVWGSLVTALASGVARTVAHRIAHS
ncbi:MAG TPA: DUF2177 family protein [Burkholderiaceae bacterium]|nr:DUF2177 family protein [Burkholderiaceae bacterium]